jgi:hypothetical protein
MEREDEDGNGKERKGNKEENEKGIQFNSLFPRCLPCALCAPSRKVAVWDFWAAKGNSMKSSVNCRKFPSPNLLCPLLKQFNMYP